MLRRPLLAVLLLLSLAACRQDMHNQPKYRPFRESDFFADKRASRPLVDDTVARGHVNDDPRLYTGKDGTEFIKTFPLPVTEKMIERGKQRYEIYCTPCHDYSGNGNGIVVQRGFKRPPSFHIDRLRGEAPGYFYDVMTNGFGSMSNYAQQISVEDRWAIAAYVRALQLSRHSTIQDVPESQKKLLEAEKQK